MSRNFGFPSETSRPMLGNETSGVLPLHSAHDTQRADNVIQLAARVPSLRGSWPNSPAKQREPFIIDTRELAARMFVTCFFGFPALFGLAVYLLLVD